MNNMLPNITGSSGGSFHSCGACTACGLCGVCVLLPVAFWAFTDALVATILLVNND